jgi:hypothetical protein
MKICPSLQAEAEAGDKKIWRLQDDGVWTREVGKGTKQPNEGEGDKKLAKPLNLSSSKETDASPPAKSFWSMLPSGGKGNTQRRKEHEGKGSNGKEVQRNQLLG